MEDILLKISERYPALPPQQRKLAEYLFHHLNQAILFNATQLAAKARVSETTVLRLANNLGFSGFAQFKRAVGRRVLADSTPRRLVEAARVLEGRDSLFADILRGDIENIGVLSAQVKEHAFQEAVEKICAARSLYVLGLRSSYSLAFYLAFNLRFFLDAVHLLDLGVGDLPERVRDIGPQDLLVAISFKRYTREVIRITEKFRERKAFILAVTNSELSPIARLSHMCLVAQTRIPAYFESYTAPMSLLNALITAVAYREKERALPRLQELERAFQSFETYDQGGDDLPVPGVQDDADPGGGTSRRRNPDRTPPGRDPG